MDYSRLSCRAGKPARVEPVHRCTDASIDVVLHTCESNCVSVIIYTLILVKCAYHTRILQNLRMQEVKQRNQGWFLTMRAKLTLFKLNVFLPRCM